MYSILCHGCWTYWHFLCFFAILGTTLSSWSAHSQTPSLVAASAAPSAAQAGVRVPAEVQSELPNARFIGSARLRFFGLQVYTARLWAAPGFSRQQPMQTAFALELQYGLSLEGERIAQRSIDEMNKQGPLPPETAQRWRAFMGQTFADVNKGDRLIGLHQPAGATKFWLNGARRGELRDPEFAQRFFDIWLSPKTSEPAMRETLLVGAP